MTPRTGPRNLITDVPGLKIGNAEDGLSRTGTTVIVTETPAICAVDVRGGGPGTRETDALAADTLVERVDAIVLSGGSVYGLAAADGVTAWLGAQGRGFGLGRVAGTPKAPIVPAAILFDLANGGDKAWGIAPPYRDLGLRATQTAGYEFDIGSVGAGAGAMAGALKGGLGSCSTVLEDGARVGALVAVNSFGSVVAPGGRAFWAGAFEIDGEFGGVGPPETRVSDRVWGLAKRNPGVGENTTLACVAVDADLTPAEARRLAVMAQDGLARAIRPVHTPFDGDLVFALATCCRPLPNPRPFALTRLGAAAADCLARAIARGVYAATAWPGGGVTTWRTLQRP